MIRFMGREFKEASPDSREEKRCPARIPDISRVVVPLLPVFRVPSGAVSPRSPRPWTRIQSGLSSMETPICRKQRMVERQSAPVKKLVISVVPWAMEPSITARWEMDLSPGTVSSPLK